MVERTQPKTGRSRVGGNGKDNLQLVTNGQAINPDANGMAKNMQVGSEREKCFHHWLIEPPNGPTSRAECKVCGRKKRFKNSDHDDSWRGFNYNANLFTAREPRRGTPRQHQESASDSEITLQIQRRFGEGRNLDDE